MKKLVRRQGGAVEATTYIDGVFEHHHRRPGGAGNREHDRPRHRRRAAGHAGPARDAPPGRSRAGRAVPARRPSRQQQRHRRRHRRLRQPRGVHPVRRDHLRQLRQEALPLQRQGTRRGERAVLPRRPLLRAVAGAVDELRPRGPRRDRLVELVRRPRRQPGQPRRPGRPEPEQAAGDRAEQTTARLGRDSADGVRWRRDRTSEGTRPAGVGKVTDDDPRDGRDTAKQRQ